MAELSLQILAAIPEIHSPVMCGQSFMDTVQIGNPFIPMFLQI